MIDFLREHKNRTFSHTWPHHLPRTGPVRDELHLSE